MTKLQETRVKLLHNMNDYILHLGDETLIGAWFITGIPDCPDE